MVHLFAGDNQTWMRGMDSYVNQFDDVDLAMNAANCADYDWAHIVTIQPDRLETINVGRWNERKQRMEWQEAPVVLNAYQTALRTYMGVLREGMMLLNQLPVSRPRSDIVSDVIEFREDVQKRGLDMPEDELRVAIYFARQLLQRMPPRFKATPIDPRSAAGKLIKKWLGQAAYLLNETKHIQFRIDVE